MNCAGVQQPGGAAARASRRHCARWSLAVLLAVPLVGLASPLQIEFRAGATRLVLDTKDARQQLLVTAADGRDRTREVVWSAEPAELVDVDRFGRVSPRKDGSGEIRATSSDGTMAVLPVTVIHSDTPAPVHFANQIVPVFTKNGCNGGGCHGKAVGQNGFRLSLLGFEPGEDYEHLTKEARGRRLFPAAPDRSLLLTKATAQLPHGGGRRLDPDSDDYELLVRWIAQGMPAGRSDAPTVTRVEVFPDERTLSFTSTQQLVVTAHYSDGSAADVTRSALFEPNDKDMAAVNEQGRVTVYNQPGTFAVMVRYQGQVATFRATIPLGAPVGELPPAQNFVDELVFKQLQKVGMPPSRLADDATFLRRVTLDVAGRLPFVGEVEAFRADPAPDRRRRVIERLLESREYAEYFANKWSALLRNKRTDARQARGTFAFHNWIRDSLAANKPFDRFVREILTAAGDLADNPPVAWYRQVRTMQSQLEDVSQLFLGQRLQCAQCHHHPYERWSQADYWSFGASFALVSHQPGSQPGEEIIVPRRGRARATNKKNGQSVPPSGLAEPAFELTDDDDPRVFLADWMTAPDNPWFAKALVNRYWKHFFGRGLVDPEDDLRETNPPSNPELLDALAAHFARGGFDLKDLVRTLTQSATYQLSAEPNAENTRDRHQFSRFYPRRLPAEVLFDSVNVLLGSESHFEGLPPGTRAVCLPDNSFNAGSYFLTVFGRPESSSACECERSMEASLSQSLHLLNSKDIQTRLSADSGRAAKWASEPGEDAARVVELYRLALGRDPSEDELRTTAGYFSRKLAAARQDGEAAEIDADRTRVRREAWEDVIWALLNTKEFLFNH